MRAYLKPPTDVNCPHYQKPMSECCATCVKWYGIRGKDPVTGQDIDGYQCTDVAMFTGLLDLSQKVNQLGAAVESTRNEVVQRMNIGLSKTLDVAPPLSRRVLLFFGGN